MRNQFIIENYGIMQTEEICKELKMSKAELSKIASILRKKGHKVRRINKIPRTWTDEEVKFLENNPDMSGKDMADKLGRSTEVVYNKRYKLGLVKVEGESTLTPGVFKKSVKVKLGQPYEIERVKKSIKDWNKFAGKCIHETKDHFTIKNKVRAETFLKVDFLINEYKMKEIA